MSTTFDFQDDGNPVPAKQHANGGGWVADTAFANALAYIGAEARVFDKARVSGEARVGHDLSGIDLSGAPVIPDIDAAVLRAIDGGACELDMDQWHTCETTHCRAGLAVHLAGMPGYALEAQVGSWLAGAMIYKASRPDKPIPNFFATTAEAMADIRACAMQ